jgi:hypothetical protein
MRIHSVTWIVCCFCVIACADEHDDDSSLGDDDTAVGDDDDSGEPTLDMAASTFHGECTPTVEYDPSHPEVIAEGWFDFEARLVGWAAECWVEFYDPAGDYCEGWDPITGDPCESDGYVRAGWPMTRDGFGFDPAEGYWDLWSVTIEYLMDLDAAAASGRSFFICENAGLTFTNEICCAPSTGGSAYCVEYLW